MIIMSLLAAAQAGAAPQVCKARFTAPIEAAWGNDGRSMRLTKATSFIDQACREWSVPAGATVDGASIPQMLWSVIGGPFEGKYRSSSVIHDWYCDRRVRSWQEVHRVFYDGMIASGVSPALAKTLYMAVYIWGPRWTQQAVLNNVLANSKAWTPEKGLDAGLKAAAFARTPPPPSTSASGAYGLMQLMPSIRSAASAAAQARVGTGELPPGVTAQDLVLSQQAQDYAVMQIQTNDNLTLDQIDAMGEQIRFLVPPGVIPPGSAKSPK